ncbi:RagB/SusD family nutrient uptake outer membrane protein [Spirosoma montaniterrae]|uniref:Carbohydrate-binding protein SusD n=1 Tax=Spirosoma montaniterrae TaxID=1178516 RepID=A0A1P9WVF8_9BACT|nr:RagB/SusD family nutrient uptake outer membrane protein [Spirosoma montaniterrae]AQG79366.1 carbohydrate-binding protein SusD [Spirosoma montaniterrae]
MIQSFSTILSKTVAKPFRYAGVAALLLLASCEVDRLPETAISDDVFWRSEADLKQAANYLYTWMPSFNNADVWSDDAFGLASNGVSDGSRLPPATDGGYNIPYALIRAANNIIEKAPRASTASVSAIERYTAEARFFRALGYFQLVQRYGGVPLILKTLTDASPELQQPAATREQVVDQMYQDLDFAALKLPTPTQLGNADYGRISNTAALAFKARVALFEGTRAKFHTYGEPAKHLNVALAAAKAVIDSRQHDLFGNYFNLFQYEGEGRQNRENVMVRQFGVSLTDRVSTHGFYRGTLENGNMNPTKVLVDAYLMKDGLPITKSPLYKTPTTTLEIFANRDNRLSETVMKRGDPMMATKPVFDVANLAFNKTGYMFRKFANIDDWNTQASRIDYPVLRYAEVLLTYAEADFELDNQISDADLELTVNRLRTRGGIAKLTNAFVAANGLDMREELRRERRVELAMEGFRYWDLIRWKTAETELPKPVLGIYFFKSEFPPATVNLTPDNFVLVQTANFRKFDPARDYLFPLPINELSLNPALKQNPGW